MTRGLIISAPASGTGKTTLTLGLIAALKKQGVKVQGFKNGPDYIDPAFHEVASGLPSFNLDCWAMPEAQISGLIASAKGADLVIAEGSMGLFDGVATRGASGQGATADLAALTGWPVVLVLDVSGQAQSAGAVALGFAKMRPDVVIAGVVANRVASPRHEMMVREGLAQAGLACLGCLPRNNDVRLPERHLGLVQAQETASISAILDEAGAFVMKHLDVDAIRAVALPCQMADDTDATARITPPGQRIALAQDVAFSFVYPHLLHGWRAAGAEILPFAPLKNEAPDQAADVCWLPGGYPELHAGEIAAAGAFRSGLREFAQTRPVHGECGGYMALGAGLIDKDGARHEMVGLLGLVTSYEKRKMHLGYRIATLNAPIPSLGAGSLARGHEFHYSTIIDQPDAPLASVRDASGNAVPETGSWRSFEGGGRVTGSFFHFVAEA
ncbi:cobyrinate a,c-diamide synthase [Albirhodobacter sp. R86504]|uniref:cobyrinate a,c-diamide synthase n=1 Tax=Albirhodobacter sp. R86504 TaxID=3093848 RepID=UPI003671A280